MFKRVDVASEEVKGFAYKNKNGFEERVVMHSTRDLVELEEKDGTSCSAIYVSDIPNMIKALQAAYEYIQASK